MCSSCYLGDCHDRSINQSMKPATKWAESTLILMMTVVMLMRRRRRRRCWSCRWLPARSRSLVLVVPISANFSLHSLRSLFFYYCFSISSRFLFFFRLIICMFDGWVFSLDFSTLHLSASLLSMGSGNYQFNSIRSLSSSLNWHDFFSIFLSLCLYKVSFGFFTIYNPIYWFLNTWNLSLRGFFELFSMFFVIEDHDSDTHWIISQFLHILNRSMI